MLMWRAGAPLASTTCALNPGNWESRSFRISETVLPFALTLARLPTRRRDGGGTEEHTSQHHSTPPPTPPLFPPAPLFRSNPGNGESRSFRISETVLPFALTLARLPTRWRNGV